MTWDPQSWVGVTPTEANFDEQIYGHWLESPNQKITAAGDIIRGTGNHALDRIAKGAHGDGVANWAHLFQTTNTCIRNNTTTLSATDVDLIVPVAAAGLYLMEWHFLIDSGGSSNPDFKCDFNGGTFPAGGSLEGNYIGLNAAGSVVADWIGAETASINAEVQSSADHFLIKVTTTYLAGGTPGNVTPRWAQNTATAVDTKLIPGSFVRWLKLT